MRHNSPVCAFAKRLDCVDEEAVERQNGEPWAIGKFVFVVEACEFFDGCEIALLNSPLHRIDDLPPCALIGLISRCAPVVTELAAPLIRVRCFAA